MNEQKKIKHKKKNTATKYYDKTNKPSFLKIQKNYINCYCQFNSIPYSYFSVLFITLHQTETKHHSKTTTNSPK